MSIPTESSHPGLAPDAEMVGQLLQLPDDRRRLRLLEAVLAFSTDLDLRTVLQHVVEAAATTVDARFGGLGVLDERKEFVDLITTRSGDHIAEAVGYMPQGRGLLGALVHDPRPMRVENMAEHPDAVGFPPGHPIMHSLLGVPIRVGGTVYGNLYLTDRRDGQPFTDADEAAVTALAGIAGVVIQNARLHGRLAHTAEELQRRLLPELADIRPVQAEARYLPASTVPHIGGDWHQVIVLPGGERCIMIGDVVGHDVEAAITMHRISNMLSGLAFDRPQAPSEIVDRFDRAVEGLAGDEMATLIVAILEQCSPASWRLRWTSAGHPPPLLVTPTGDVGYLAEGESPGVVIGVDPSLPRSDHEHVLAPRDTVIFYTDGLIENPSQTLDDGMDALARRAGALARRRLPLMCDGLVDLKGGTFHDDVALLALRIPDPEVV